MRITDFFFITLNDYFQTRFVAPALTWCNMGIWISVCSSVRSCVRQAVNICDHPSANPLNVQINFCQRNTHWCRREPRDHHLVVGIHFLP